MSDLIDVSVRLRAGMPIWPTSTGLHVSQSMRIADGAEANVTQLDMDVHCGTHVEGPLHFLADGLPLDALPLDTFVGPALVVAVGDETAAITPETLASAGIPDGTIRLLLRTRNSTLWHEPDTGFRRDYVALTTDAARWLVERGVRLVGIDYLSIQRFGDDPETHRVLFRGGAAILEGLDLSEAPPGRYTLACLPLRLEGAEATPVRAVLMPLMQPRANE